MKPAMRAHFVLLFFLLVTGFCRAASKPLPVRGLHMAAPKPDEVPLCLHFIRDALPKEGVNVLVMEFDYRYQFTSHPEVADQDALSKADVEAIAAAARESGVRLIPLINLLGHQSWARQTFGLLRAHPEFDETPGKYPNNQGIYCRSYCPLHPEVHKVAFDLLDELATVCGADAVHVGMDEVFLIGENDCSRCRGRSRAELFAQEARTLHDHLAQSHREMWMWGDRLLDGYVTGVGEWEGSQNGTAAAINDIPRDIVICDWHYDVAVPTAAYFAVQGFRVVAAPWQKSDVALGELELVRSVRAHANDIVAPRMLGMLQTSWGSFSDFVNAYYAKPAAGNHDTGAVDAFKILFSKIREGTEVGGASASSR